MKKLLIVLLALCLLLAACTPNPEDEVGSTDPAPTSEAPTEEPAGESDGAIHLPKVEF